MSSTDTWSEPSTPSADSVPTTASHSSSDETVRTEHSPALTSSASPSGIQYQQRIFVTGPTESGKSRLARELFLSAASPRLVIDPSDSSIFGDVAGVETFRDPLRPPNVATARFVPDDPQDRDAYDAVYRWAFHAGPRYVLLDEAGVAAPSSGSPRWVRTLVVQGRKRSIGHVACHTRPIEVDRNLIAQAAHVFVFGCHDPDDRRYLAQQMEVPRELLGAELVKLDRFEFLWWDRTARKLTACPALPA